MGLRDLNWADVDPGKHTFDAESALIVAVQTIKETPVGDQDWAQMVEDAIDRSFTAQYGSWAAGWRFSTGEGSLDGGVVSAWCCPHHSVLCSGPDEDVVATAQRAAVGLKQWREHLHHVKELFAELTPRLADRRMAALDLHSAGGRIVTFAAMATGAESGWYVYVGQLLSWYLQSLGLEAEIADEQGGFMKGRLNAGRSDWGYLGGSKAARY